MPSTTPSAPSQPLVRETKTPATTPITRKLSKYLRSQRKSFKKCWIVVLDKQLLLRPSTSLRASMSLRLAATGLIQCAMYPRYEYHCPLGVRTKELEADGFLQSQIPRTPRRSSAPEPRRPQSSRSKSHLGSVPPLRRTGLPARTSLLKSAKWLPPMMCTRISTTPSAAF